MVSAHAYIRPPCEALDVRHRLESIHQISTAIHRLISHPPPSSISKATDEGVKARFDATDTDALRKTDEERQS